MSIIDTLTAGFGAVRKRLWLLALPIALDLFLWLGPKVSVAPIVEQLARVFDQAMGAVGSQGALDANMAQMLGAFTEELRNSVGRTNLLVLLASTRLGLPSLGVLRPINLATDRVIALSQPLQMLGAQLVLLMLGLFLACFFLGALGQEARGEEPNLGKLLQRAPVYWLNMMMLFVPLAFFVMMAVFSTALFGPFAFIIWVLILWALFYLSFAPQAITMAEGNPIQAMVSSFAVVRANFWATLGLFLLVNVISTGLGILWQRLMVYAWGNVVAILANSFVGTGLALAWFIFYRDRLIRLRQALQAPPADTTNV